MSPAHQNGPLILTLHDGCTHSAHRAYSTLPRRAVFDKSHNRPASPVRRLMIEATFTLWPSDQ